VAEAEAGALLVEASLPDGGSREREAEKQKGAAPDTGQVGEKMQAGTDNEVVGLREMEAAEMCEGTRGRRTRG